VDRDQLRQWLTLLPTTASSTEAIDLLGALASRIAESLRTRHPDALPATSHPLARTLPDELAVPDILGPAWETLMASDDRRQLGAHFTPQRVADDIVGIACQLLPTAVRDGSQVPVVWDPTCGGGAFLLSAARALAARGHDPAAVIGSMYGTDIDPVALQVAGATLQLWAPHGERPVLASTDVLVDVPASLPASGVDLVVGNPPFLSQLTTDTARSVERRAKLLERFGPAARGYVDDAGLVLLAALEHVSEHGVVALVLPQSILGASDAQALRSQVDSIAHLQALWIESGGAFEAAVDVVAPVFSHSTSTAMTMVHHDGRELVLPESAHGWAAGLALAQGVPQVPLGSGAGTIRQLADITAGFRQHFYGIADAVREAEDDDDPNRLVTSGAIEPLWNRWGMAHIKFAGNRWHRPVVDLDRVEDADVAGWFRDRRVPKLLIASQTPVPEVVVDPGGVLLPSVPVISVEPHDPHDLWRLAAILSSPVVAAMLATQSAGTGLSTRAIRVRASDLAAVPLPADEQAWNDGAVAAEQAHAAAHAGHHGERQQHLRALAAAMATAFGCTAHADELMAWWWERIRFPAEAS
jgi:hypothetical protein